MSIRYNNASPKSKDEIKMNRFRKKRNQAMNNIFDKYNLPRNMANNQIKRRVKYHDWVHKQSRDRLGDSAKQKYIELLMDRTVFNEKKRKDMVKLALDYGNDNILSLRSPVIIAYLHEIRYFYDGSRDLYFSSLYILKDLKVFGKFREDKALETVLKKRIAFLRKLKRGGPRTVYVPTNVVSNLAHGNELKNFIQRRLDFEPSPFLNFVIGVREGYLGFRNLARSETVVDIVNILIFMREFYPIPPHTNSTKRRAATTIQKTVRGMLNRKKVKARTASAERKETLKRKRKR